MTRLVVLLGVVMAVAMASPGGGEAASFNEVRKLAASDAEADDEFGLAVTISGDIAVVGAHNADAVATNAGAAYVFQRDEGGTGTWGEVARLTASDGEANDEFGWSVAVNGDTAVIGAINEGAGASFAGAAYVFQRDEGGADNWGQVTKLIASDPGAVDRFGWSVAVSGDTAVIGARGEDTEATDAGAAYVFQRDEGGANNWGEVTKLTASDAEASDQFGWSVAVSGDTAVVGAQSEDAGGSEAGAVYVFQRDEGGANNWGEVKKLTASDPSAHAVFGASVALDDDVAVVGAAIFYDPRGSYAGAAYVFQRDEGGVDNWGQVTKLTASDAEAQDFFGASVAVDAAVVIGAPLEDTGGADTGAVYVFERNDGGTGHWGEVKKLTASDAEAADRFGMSVAFDGDTAVVGAEGEDGGGSESGAAYIFERTSEPPPPQEIPGDASCDGAVSAIDATFVLQFTAALLDLLPCEDGADANVDGLVNALDAAVILQFVAGLLEGLPHALP